MRLNKVFKWSIMMMLMLALAGLVVLFWKGMSQESAYATASSEQMRFPKWEANDIRYSNKTFSTQSLLKQTSVIHFWATWCAVCVAEQSILLEISQKWPYPIIGIVYRDNLQRALDLVAKMGDPYRYLIEDPSGSLGVALGITGTPETFVVDKKGVIRFHHRGHLSLQSFQAEILPILEKVEAS